MATSGLNVSREIRNASESFSAVCHDSFTFPLSIFAICDWLVFKRRARSVCDMPLLSLIFEREFGMRSLISSASNFRAACIFSRYCESLISLLCAAVPRGSFPFRVDTDAVPSMWITKYATSSAVEAVLASANPGEIKCTVLVTNSYCDRMIWFIVVEFIW